eukprot:scaffold953_cov141-Cylindrotheca_fusiformis.AAC.17
MDAHQRSSRSFNSCSSRVSFGQVKVREYPRAITDNPAVSDGPPIGIGWDYDTEADYPIDQWEGDRMYFRRNHTELLVPRDERHERLVEAGCSEKEIAGSIRNVLKVKYNRRQTVNNLKAAAVEEFMEKTSRKVKSAFCIGKSRATVLDYELATQNRSVGSTAA